MLNQNRLFDIETLETNPAYISPQEKKKWNAALKKYILDEYNKNDGTSSYMLCGYMNYCQECQQKYCNGCSDCLVAIKSFCKKNGIDINYKDFDFKSLINKLEAIKC